ncbi:MAG: hypothetical protein KIT68_02420 [Phycisphaeraceae bacterium]|nr:hypothetical protein [Phycisphaeraceae bacterium]
MHDDRTSLNLLPDAAAQRLLGLAADGVAPEAPLIALIERLERPDAQAWLADCLALEPLSIIAGPVRGQLADLTPLEDLQRLKRRSKRLLAASAAQPDRLRAALGYFLAVGLALARHGQLISSRPRPIVNASIVDLASALPPAWAAALEAAIQPPPAA